jgi:predicted AlkP superfamily pyrophosphatase or phosphodiesterase
MARRDPTLALVYLPHLDYDLQRFGPDERAPQVAASLHAVDAVAGDLIADAARSGRRLLVLSEYGLTAVDTPIPINRALREAGLLAVREEDGGELLDPIASRTFAVADHQIAHIYVAEPDLIEPVRRILQNLPGVAAVWGEAEKRAEALDHPRSGELIAVAEPRAWFTYYYWLDDRRAPDFARTVEIHRKPGYDPAEIFFDPAVRAPKLAVGSRLLRRALGFRTLMDVIPLDASLVKGSHGRPTAPDAGPVVIGSEPRLLPDGSIAATDVKELILAHVFGPSLR